MFRTVLIKKASKLQCIQGYLVIYDGDQEKKVFLKDITMLLIEATNSLITVPLLVEFIKNNISVVFCDNKHNPVGGLLGFNNNYLNSGNIYKQIEWEDLIKSELWAQVIQAKITMQLNVLKMFDKTNQELLEGYIENVELSDVTNREGLAAKVYFNSLFGLEFNRKEQSALNDMLNYGYAIILSCFNREIVQAGYLTQLGIFHKGKTNPFNLSYDFLEPFRPIIDIIAYGNTDKEDPIKEMRKILTKKIIINSEERFIDDAIRVYVKALIRYLNKEVKKFPSLKLKEKEHYINDKSNENTNNVWFTSSTKERFEKL